MSRAPFKFKQFAISAHDAGMAVSTDGVLLGAWNSLNGVESVLDIGTGTGLLALMTAQRNPHASIVAIDVEPSAIQAATHNIEISPWAQRIELYQQDVTALTLPALSLPNAGADCIICNPPYFDAGESSKNAARASARHTVTLSHTRLAKACQRLLNEGGHASFILPHSEGLRFIDNLKDTGMSLSRITYVKTTPTKPVSRLLIECTKQDAKTYESQLVIQKNGHYSDAFIDLTRAFYLKMPN